MLLLTAVSQLKRLFYRSALVGGAVVCSLAALGLLAPRVQAQVGVAAVASAPAASKLPKPAALVKTSSVPKPSAKPAWQDLTPAQQLALQPLAANWNTLEQDRKRKWIAIAANYANLSPTEQAKIHSRMSEWAALSQQQRTQARLNFARAKKISPNQKTATWQAYQSLSVEEKKELAIAAPPKPVGAAAATKPVSSKKLTSIAVTRQASKPMLATSAAIPTVDRKTLLPKAKPPLKPASASSR